MTFLTRREFLLAAAAAVDRRKFLDRLQLVTGPLPQARRGRPDTVIDETAEFPGYTRRKIRYRTEPDDWTPAYLFLPQRTGRAPAMLCLHQTVRLGKGEPAGLGGNANLHYARELAERGYVTLAPDYPNFGDYVFDPYAHGYASATMKGIWNHLRAVDLLESMPQVERRRIGSIGHSLGGHNTLFVGVFDPRLRALVTSCGFTSFGRYKGGNLTGWSHRGYMPRIADRYGKDPSRMPFDFPELLAALAPRPLFINAPVGDGNFDITGVKECVAFARRVYAPDRLVALHPDCGHEFPPEIRRQAYDFLDRFLGPTSPGRAPRSRPR
jgi:dienelactone hydrolase